MQTIVNTFTFLAFALVHSVALCASSATYRYDARGRLIQVLDNSHHQIDYHYDAAGNRLFITNENPTPPTIVELNGPIFTTKYTTVNISWLSTNAVSCDLTSNMDNYLNLPTVGSLNITITDDTGIILKCYGYGNYSTKGKLIRISDSK